MFYVKVHCAEDCGNAPKKRLLRDICIDYWGGGGHGLLENVVNEVAWNIIGARTIVGIEAVQQHLAQAHPGRPVELFIHNIITHGNVASLNLTAIMPGGTRIEQCDVYRFSGFGRKAKIKEITSYVVRIDG